MNTRFLVFLLWIVFSACSVQAGIIHDSVPDANYIARGALFPATGHTSGGSSQTLIHPRVAITAAHSVAGAVANDLQVSIGFSSNYLTDPQPLIAVEEIVIHPDYVAIGNGPDIALLFLEEEVTGITPVPLYQGQLQLGDVLDHVGYGLFGRPSTGIESEPDGHKRGFRNRVDSFGNNIVSFLTVSDDYVGTIFPRFQGTGLDGAVSPGDSGGGVYQSDELAAVISFQSGIPNYGARSGSTMLFDELSWINETIATYTIPEPSSLLLALPMVFILFKRR